MNHDITGGNCKNRRQDFEHDSPQVAEGVASVVSGPRWTEQPATGISQDMFRD